MSEIRPRSITSKRKRTQTEYKARSRTIGVGCHRSRLPAGMKLAGHRRMDDTRRPPLPPAPGAKRRLLDQMRDSLRLLHYSYRTEEVYVGWVRRFILFHDKRHPLEMGPAEITQFLTSLATVGKVSASTQNQALAALLFLYQQVLGCEVGWLDEIVRAKRPKRLPTVLTREEVQLLMNQLDGSPPAAPPPRVGAANAAVRYCCSWPLPTFRQDRRCGSTLS